MRTCPICGWQGDQFLPQNLKFKDDPSRQLHKDCTCPSCKSHHRHRSAWLTLDHFNLPAPNQAILHVAPEPFLVSRMRENAQSYTAIDIYIDARFEGIEVKKMSLTELEFKDDTFDFIYCAHVLEHIPDDRKAIGEIFRVLKSGAKAALSVPIYPIEKTADLYPLSPDKMNHVHQPGKDYFDRYREAGFNTEVYYPEDLFDVDKYGLRKIWDPMAIVTKP
ncbi:class I SAM-dependent methyltransferase [Alteromonas sediminis]|uniref:Class I SAM-dependent methyltransferase n=1 Tax=Alteromonas sediminis TaxID=2259342 RepID=A0A3N5Y531_9ALTE|nr:class I SAM-dependent methyltransferase [Alteromonas sediminis]RPJ68086.1 class I SAM-dependent methyltransferase [Alteromonas sediminis]